MYLVFDAKHFGTPRPELPLEHHSQPIVFQFCGIVYDHNGTELDVVCAPEPATSEPTDLTITEPRNEITAAQRRGDYVPPTQVFSWFKRWADQCEIIVGHNAHFDLHAMRALGAAMLGIDWIPKGIHPVEAALRG